LECNVIASTIGHALAITIQWRQGIQLNAVILWSYEWGYAHLDTVEVQQDEVSVLTKDFPSKHFICSFIGLQAQK